MAFHPASFPKVFDGTNVFNHTQQAQILEALFKSTASSSAPLLLFESFVMGALCVGVFLLTYLIWVIPHSFSRAHFISVLWIVLASIITHWALLLQQLESTLSGRSLGISLTYADLLNDINTLLARDADYDITASHILMNIAYSYSSYRVAWQYLLPLVTETVLLGVSSCLFAIVAYTDLRSPRSQRRSCGAMIIPFMALFMYILSLSHWAISLLCFIAQLALADLSPVVNPKLLNVALVPLFSFSAVMSDAIVLWRMLVVWDRKRPAIAFSAALLIVTLGLSIASIIVNAHNQLSVSPLEGIIENAKDSEIISAYGRNPFGLVAAFLSLACNLCATVLVGIKAWLHRREFSRAFHSAIPRTLVTRVMELLVESGVAYTSIWLLYCISFFRPITTQVVLGPDLQTSSGTTQFMLGANPQGSSITATSHLDAAMAQITSIYPLVIFTLIALDKIHHSRGPPALRTDDLPMERGFAATTMPLEIEAEPRMAQSLGPPRPMVAFQRKTYDGPSAVGEAKLLESGGSCVSQRSENSYRTCQTTMRSSLPSTACDAPLHSTVASDLRGERF